MKLRIVRAHEVHSLLPMKTCVELMRTAMALPSTGGTLQPIRSKLDMPNKRGILGMMPGYLADPQWLGIKVISVFPGNFGTQYGSHQGMVLLFEPQNGVPVAMLDAREITAIRTAASSAVATDVLARKDAKSLAILGYGEQAGKHIEAILEVRRIERILIWGRSAERAREFAGHWGKLTNVPATAVDTAEEAVRSCDIVCATTASSEPFVMGEWFQPGLHFNAVGSSIPSTAEIDTAAVQRSRFFVDYVQSALSLAGEFRRAKEQGAVDDSHILGQIGDILTGKVQGRVSPDDITVFKSLGMVAEDLVAADHIYRQAEEQNVGISVDY